VTLIECPREQDVVDAVATGRWPDRVDPELMAHIAGCHTCGDVALVAAAIDAEHEAAWPQAQVPSSAHVWWRAQMRARREAALAAARPITLAQGVAAAAAVGLAAAWVTWIEWPRFIPADGWLVLPGSLDAMPLMRDAVRAVALTAASLPHQELAVAAGAVLLLAPAALYFVFSDR
jgi:hypothetical protein